MTVNCSPTLTGRSSTTVKISAATTQAFLFSICITRASYVYKDNTTISSICEENREQLTVARFINLPMITTLDHNGINGPFPETKGDNDISVLYRHPETFYNKYIFHDSHCCYRKKHVYDTNFQYRQFILERGQ